MLAKAGSLKTLEENISHAKAFEMAMRDQNEIPGVSDMAGLRMSAYRQQRQAQDVARSTATHRRERTVAETRPQQNACRGCGSHQHGEAGSGDRPQMYPSWGQICRACGKQTTFRWSASWKAQRNEVLCNALGMRKPPWMPSLHT